MASAIPEQPRSHLDLIPPLIPLRAWECIFTADLCNGTPRILYIVLAL